MAGVVGVESGKLQTLMDRVDTGFGALGIRVDEEHRAGLALKRRVEAAESGVESRRVEGVEMASWRAAIGERVESLEASRATLVGQVNGLVERGVLGDNLLLRVNNLEEGTGGTRSGGQLGAALRRLDDLEQWRTGISKRVDDLRDAVMNLEVESGRQTEGIVRVLDRLKQVERATYIPEDERRYPTKGFETLSEFVKGPRPMLTNDDEGGPSREQIAAKRAAGETLNYEEAWAATYDEQLDVFGPAAVEGVSREAMSAAIAEQSADPSLGHVHYSRALERAMEIEGIEGVPESELRPEPLPESEGVKLMPVIDPLTGKPIEPLPPAGAAMGVDGELVLEAKPEGGPPPMLLARMTNEGAVKLVVDPSDNSIEAGKEPLLDPFSEAVAALVQMVRRGDTKDKNVIRAAKALLDETMPVVLDDAATE